MSTLEIIAVILMAMFILAAIIGIIDNIIEHHKFKKLKATNTQAQQTPTTVIHINMDVFQIGQMVYSVERNDKFYGSLFRIQEVKVTRIEAKGNTITYDTQWSGSAVPGSYETNGTEWAHEKLLFATLEEAKEYVTKRLEHEIQVVKTIKGDERGERE